MRRLIRDGLRAGNRRQGGFTLIELITVIIILAILAAAALPRFANLQTQSRIAKLNGAMGAMKGASALAHAGCLSTVPECTGTYLMEGVNVTMVNKYPTADAAGIVSAAGMTVGPTSTDGWDVAGGGSGAGDVLTVMVLGNVPANCSYTYTSAGLNMAPVFSTLITSGC